MDQFVIGEWKKGTGALKRAFGSHISFPFQKFVYRFQDGEIREGIIPNPSCQGDKLNSSNSR